MTSAYKKHRINKQTKQKNVAVEAPDVLRNKERF